LTQPYNGFYKAAHSLGVFPQSNLEGSHGNRIRNVGPERDELAIDANLRLPQRHGLGVQIVPIHLAGAPTGRDSVALVADGARRAPLSSARTW
jgi:hypothetical protein